MEINVKRVPLVLETFIGAFARASLLGFLAPALSACVISPVDLDGVHDRHGSFSVTGYGSEPGQTILVRAWNYDRGAWELVDSAVTRSSSIGNEVKLYGYEVSSLRLSKRYWQPLAVPCTIPGTARLKVYRTDGTSQHPLATFTEEGIECIGDELATGAEPAGAGLACRTGEEVRLVAPPQCAPAGAPLIPTGGNLTLRISDDVDVVEAGNEYTWISTVLDAWRPVRVSADYRAYAGVRTVQLSGNVTVTCRRADGSRRDVTSTHEARRTQPPSGALDQMLGVSLTFDLPALRTRCGTEPFLSIRGDFEVDATSATGGTESTFAPFTFTAR